LRVCYVDESGCTGVLPSSTSDIQPAFVIAGIILDYSKLHSATHDLLSLKQRFYPALVGKHPHYLGGILEEVKGAELRRQIARGNRNQRRHSFGFIDGLFRILKSADARVIGRVWVKGIAQPINGRSIYTYSIQSIYQAFQNYLIVEKDYGTVVLDSRWQGVNKDVAHSIFTQKFRAGGDAYDRIIDLPAFGHSINHAGLQLSDLLASAVLFPMATHTYCSGIVHSVHVDPGYGTIKARYKDDLRKIQYRYMEASGKKRGGITVSDQLSQKPGGELFR